MKHFPFQPFAACVLAIALTAAAEDGGSRAVRLSGTVVGWTGKHPLYVALWDQDGFLVRPARQMRLEPGGPADFYFDVAPGRWALSAFEDRNENGVLDSGLFGPTEPAGFWRPFHAWRKPRFDDVVAIVDRNTSNADIQLK